jgi:DNA-binding PadR family transcriptional regulator
MFEEYLPLNHADFHILLGLADEERHGYAIMLHVEELTDGALKLGPGTLYTSIKRLLTATLIEESDDRPDESLDDQRRRYYRLTRLGRKVLTAETERMSRMLRHARAKRILRTTS